MWEDEVENRQGARHQLRRTRSQKHILHLSVLLLVAAFIALAVPALAPAQNNVRTLPTLREVTRMSNIDARNAYPVRVEGVVTYSDPEWGLLFVDDGTGAIYVNVHGVTTAFPVGSRVRVNAVTGPGDIGTVLANPHVEIVGQGELPTPEHHSLAELNARAADSRFVETRGVLRAGDQPDWPRVCFRIFDGNASALLVVPQAANAKSRQLVGARVRVRGVSGLHLDSKGKIAGTLLLVNRLEDIEVDGGAAPNANALAVIVNKENSISNLSWAELRRILLGERRYWKNSESILLLLPNAGTPERAAMLRLLGMAGEDDYKEHWASSSDGGEGSATATASGLAVNLVAETPTAIAVVPLAEVKGSVKLVSVEGHLPSDSGYPLF